MDRHKAIEAVRILNDLWWDILAGDGLFQLLQEHTIRFRSEPHLKSVQQMVFFHLAMVLCKLAEFHKHYSESIENIPAGFRAREAYRILGPNEFIERFEMAEPNKAFEVYSEARFKRKQ